MLVSGAPSRMDSEWEGRLCLRQSRVAGPRERSVCPWFLVQRGDGQRKRSTNTVRNQEDAGDELKVIKKARGLGEVQERSNQSRDAESSCGCQLVGRGVDQLNLNTQSWGIEQMPLNKGHASEPDLLNTSSLAGGKETRMLPP